MSYRPSGFYYIEIIIFPEFYASFSNSFVEVFHAICSYQYGRDAPRYGGFTKTGWPVMAPRSRLSPEEADIPIERVKLLAPIVPGKIILVGRNYADHAKEQSADLPDVRCC
jgi:2-keto-4-pentenoate hydratase/2-oxohepta-3-ene-1,7-dioic acid hydratase in catechol pathway